jgi:hypothetical protein
MAQVKDRRSVWWRSTRQDFWSLSGLNLHLDVSLHEPARVVSSVATQVDSIADPYPCLEVRKAQAVRTIKAT